MRQRGRPPISAEIRSAAVRLAKHSGKPIPEVAQEMGVSSTTIRNWLKEDRAEEKCREDAIKEQQLREELEVMKKAAVYFAKEITR